MNDRITFKNKYQLYSATKHFHAFQSLSPTFNIITKSFYQNQTPKKEQQQNIQIQNTTAKQQRQRKSCDHNP